MNSRDRGSVVTGDAERRKLVRARLLGAWARTRITSASSAGVVDVVSVVDGVGVGVVFFTWTRLAGLRRLTERVTRVCPSHPVLNSLFTDRAKIIKC